MNLSKSKWLIFFVTVMGNFLAFLDSNSVSIALYDMSKDFNLSISRIQWVYTVYMLVLTSFLPFCGKLSDILKRNKLYSLGFIFFGTGALFNFLAPNFYCLLASRAIEGLGGSILLSNSMAIIATIMRGKKRGKALGLLGAIVAFSGLIGPAFAGIILHFCRWNFIFLPIVPIAFTGAYLSYKMVPCVESKQKKLKFDYYGFFLFMTMMFSFLLLVFEGHAWGWNSPRIHCLEAIAILSSIIFYVREKMASNPMVNFSMFNNKIIKLGDISILACYIAMFSNTVLFPFFSQEILGYDAFKTAILLLPFPVVVMFLAPYVGKHSSPKTIKYTTLAGGLLIALGLFIFTTLDEKSTIIPILIAQLLMGAGSAMFQSPSNTAVMSASDKKNFGITSGFVALSRNMGMIFGVAMSISVFDMLRNLYLAQNIAYNIAFTKAYHQSISIAIIAALWCGFTAHNAFKRIKA